MYGSRYSASVAKSPPKVVSGYSWRTGKYHSPAKRTSRGLSLAMSSANRLSPNRTIKIHKDHQPRRLALNCCQRRRLIGLKATSAPPRFEVDARVHRHVSEIAHQVQHQPEQREHEQGAEDHRIVAVDDSLVAKQPQPVQRENDLDQQRTGEQYAHESGRESGDDHEH